MSLCVAPSFLDTAYFADHHFSLPCISTAEPVAPFYLNILIAVDSHICQEIHSTNPLSMRVLYFSAVVALVTTTQAAASRSCAQFSPGPVPISELATYFPRQKISKLTDLADIDEIRQQLAQYAFSIDGRDFSALTEVFIVDAVANYSAPLGVLNGLASIETTLSAALSQFPGTQHHLGTQRVRLCEKDTAISATYYRAAHYLQQNATGGALQVIDTSGLLVAYSQYQDSWVKRNGTWKIAYRNHVYMVSCCNLQVVQYC